MNFVTPTAHTALAPAFVRIEGGSFGALGLNAQASRVQGDVDALVNVTRSHQDGYRSHANQDYTQGNANTASRPASKPASIWAPM